MTRPADSHGDWVLHRPSGHGGAQLFVPPNLAAELTDEHRRREAERVAAETKSNEERRAAEAAKAASANPAPAPTTTEAEGPPFHPYAVGTHRVLVNIERIRQRLSDLKQGAQGDADHAKRELHVLKQALKFGAGRPVGVVPWWRDSLVELAEELPGFRAVTDLVRNAHAAAEAADRAPAVPPMLLVGPPGVGKSYFCRRLMECLELRSSWLAFDQPSAGSQLRGSDKYWSNATHGILFELLALGDSANPLVVLDEIDKAGRRHTSRDIDTLAQLHSCLEPETARRITDISLDVELDASLVTYVATANALSNLGSPLLSRFEVIQVDIPSPTERRESARRVMTAALERLGLEDRIRVSPGAVVVLESYSPRVIRRATEKAVGAALAAGRDAVSVEDFEVALGLAERVRAPVAH
jgi:ATP-dependent Lon protease